MLILEPHMGRNNETRSQKPERVGGDRTLVETWSDADFAGDNEARKSVNCAVVKVDAGL